MTCSLEGAIAKELRINERILAPQLRVIRNEEQLGIIPHSEALRLAEEVGLDLVEVAPTADPPVCRIMDYGKYKYEQSKRDKESRKGIKHSELREVRMRVKIDEHDLDFKARTARKLLAEGDKVKVSVMFRAREESRTRKWAAKCSTSSSRRSATCRPSIARRPSRAACSP